MALNEIQIPLLNPIRFYLTDRSTTPKFFTKHFDDFMFEERLYEWQQPEDYCQIWQKEDIINLQFESTFDPIIVNLIDMDGNRVIELPALIGLPSEHLIGYYNFEVAMSLASVTTGCYYLELILGTAGPDQRIAHSPLQYISATPIANSILIQYWNSRFTQDVLFETGIVFQYRVHGSFGFLEPMRKDEAYRDQKWNNTILNSMTGRKFPIHFGNEFGLPDDHIDMLNRIWSVDHVMVDDKLWAVSEGGKMEFNEIDSLYPKRGVSLVVEEGINRNSKIIGLTTDPTKKAFMQIMVSTRAFGDLANQGSSNTVPVFNFTIE